MWAEDDFHPTSVPCLQSYTEPEDGKTYIMYHGTTPAAAGKIKRNGFCPSEDGMLGHGVYVSRDLQKASNYPIKVHEHQRVVLKLKVNVGKVKKIDTQGHPLQKTWHKHGYDTAWVPPHCGMVKSGLEEDCVWDPRRITVISEIHPRVPYPVCNPPGHAAIKLKVKFHKTSLTSQPKKITEHQNGKQRTGTVAGHTFIEFLPNSLVCFRSCQHIEYLKNRNMLENQIHQGNRGTTGERGFSLQTRKGHKCRSLPQLFFLKHWNQVNDTVYKQCSNATTSKTTHILFFIMPSITSLIQSSESSLVMYTNFKSDKDTHIYSTFSEPVSGNVYIMYHGTTKEAVEPIKRNGFCPSEDGMLGQGVYMSRDLQKASRYPIEVPEQQRRVLKLKVDVGKVKKINKQGHHLQKTWHEHGYDTAWVPPHCGMVKSGLEEDCVWDPRRIKVMEVIKPSRLPPLP
uniref:Grass carp reovirus (GCRV)-induced gene 2e n=1 Tax=Lepisosteus oculatus TaxID=7918 RepID=W5MFG6_LEPOC